MRLIRLLKRDLAGEMHDWVANGLVDTEQADAIAEFYGFDRQTIISRSPAYGVLLTLGFTFVGLALITLISANWNDISPVLRMFGLVALTVVVQGLAVRAYLKDKLTQAGALMLFGNICFGAAIILIAQIYHLGEHMPDGVFWWAIGSLPGALLLANTWLMLFSLGLASLWAIMDAGFGYFPSFYMVFLAGSIWLLIKGKQNVVLLLATVAAVGTFLAFCFSAACTNGMMLEVFVEHTVVGAAFFVLCYAVSLLLGTLPHHKAKDYGAILALWTLRFALGLLLVLSFADLWRELIRTDWTKLRMMIAFVSVLLIAALVIAARAAALPQVAAAAGALLLATADVVTSDDSAHALYFQVAVNIVLVLSGAWLIISGLRGSVSHYFFLGISVILVVAMFRYFDLVGDYIGATVLFAVFALVLLGAAAYWKRHQQMAVAA